MATPYRVQYAILPPGVGPDDYESADLVHREQVYMLSDPEPAGTVAGQSISYGPHIRDVEEAVTEDLAQGERPLIIRWDAV
ncbi:hypothetical protein ACH4JZ_18285 [Streptomyces sp. NPDC017615]|uniref:hypothetical protein n=1 Tax=Streptomyces sp. NPDC017615 TaxID=3365003 RepID=UPI0037936398